MDMVMVRSLGIAAIMLGAASAASAERIELFVFENADNADVSGLDLWVDVVDRGSYADFVFHNSSTVQSFVRSIYMESTAFSQTSLEDGRIGDAQPAGVRFEEGGSPPDPAGSISGFGGAWQGNFFRARAASPGNGKDGIDPGESLTLQFDYAGIDYQSLIGALTGSEPAFRIVQHVQGLPGGSSVWNRNGGDRNAVVPLPSAAGMALAAAALGGLRRRR